MFDIVKKYNSEFIPLELSKAVNADGTPKVMYRGTPEGFTIFGKKKAKSSGYYGRGFYFTESNTHANQYGDAMKVYLNIKNPLKPDENELSKDQLRVFLEAVSENKYKKIWVASAYIQKRSCYTSSYNKKFRKFSCFSRLH